jgi:hypothetical protein
MDGSSIVAPREKEYKKILLFGFVTCKTLNYKALRTKTFEGGYYDMTQREAYMGVKCICNGVNVSIIVVSLIKGPHVQCVNRYIQISCSPY